MNVSRIELMRRIIRGARENNPTDPKATLKAILIVVVQPFEDAKKFVRILGTEPNAVVLDVMDVVLCVASTADFHHGVFPSLGELNRVGQQMN